jgi:histidine triad (HIT) family protein
MSDCLFCKIVAGEIPVEKISENAEFIAFSDIDPKAPVHKLVIPKQHYENLSQLAKADSKLAGRMNEFLVQLADDLSLSNGYRIVFNTGALGGQSVFHVHGHLLGGRQMSWPAG